MRNRCYLYSLILISFSAQADIYEIGYDPTQPSWGSNVYNAFAKNVSGGGGASNPYWTYHAEDDGCSACDAGGGGNAPFSAGSDFQIAVDSQTDAIGFCENKNGDATVGCDWHLEYCASGQFYNSATGNCEPLVDTTCTEAGQVITPLTVGGVTSYWCLPDLAEQPCSKVLGTFNGQTICGDGAAACEAQGGTYGFIGAESTETCIPDDYADQLPTCTHISQVNAIDGGFACTSGETIDPSQNVPDSNPDNLIDTDGDGIPDINDPDIDGDGIPNSTDGDIDGDGVPNEDDIQDTGDQSVESSVEGGASCDVSPKCTGDSIQCAILYQTWVGRCSADTIGNETQAEIDALTSGDDPSTLYQPDNDLTSTLGDVFNQTGATVSCPAPTVINVMNTNLEIKYDEFCNLATTIRPVVILIFSIMSFKTVMGAF